MTTAAAGSRTSLVLGIVLLMMAFASSQTSWGRLPGELVQIGRAEPPALSAAPRVDITARVTPDPVERLDRATIATSFRAPGDVREPLVARLEVVGNARQETVLTMEQSGFRIPGRGARALYWEWRVPDSVPPGEYALRLKVVGLDSGRVYAEEERAATFTVAPR